MTIKSRLLLGVALCIGSSTAVLADDFTIDGPATTTNNDDVLDGDDTITVTNTGSVSTTGVSIYGLSADGDNNVLINSGDITTVGIEAHGMRASGDNNTLTNNGDINSVGLAAHGMFAGDLSTTNFNILTNTGRITTNGDNLGGSNDGMHGGGLDYNTLMNSGDINVNEISGDSGRGMFVGSGSFNTLTNSGNITVNGNAGHGMHVAGASSVLINSGNISVSELRGTGAHGMWANGSSENVLINSGNITVYGSDGHGMWANSASSTITNSGTVLSDDGYSVRFTRSDATLNLLSGSVLYGVVNFDEFSTATLNFGSGLNAAVTLSSEIPASDITITAPGAYTVVGDTVYVTDLGDYAAQDQASGIASRLVHDAVATRGVVPAVTQGSVQSGTWASVTGSLVRNSGDASLTGYDGMIVSGSFGRDRLDGPGVFAGVSLSQTETDSGVNNDAIGVHGGIYGQLGGADYTLSVGLSYNDTARQQANNIVPGGLETASDSYLSLFVSPSMTWHGLLGGNDSLRLAYTGSYYGSHSFDFSAGDLAIDSRFTHQLEARVAWARVIETGTVRYGLDLGYQSGDEIGLTLAGQSLSASTPGDEAYGRVFAGMDFANGTVEASYDNNNEVGLTGSYTWRF
jgi:hypothetical protein